MFHIDFACIIEIISFAVRWTMLDWNCSHDSWPKCVCANKPHNLEMKSQIVVYFGCDSLCECFIQIFGFVNSWHTKNILEDKCCWFLLCGLWTTDCTYSYTYNNRMHIYIVTVVLKLMGILTTINIIIFVI